MIYKKYDFTLELTCDKCHKKKRWKNQGEYPDCNMNGNVIIAKSEGWRIVKHSCHCPKCKLVRNMKEERGEVE